MCVGVCTIENSTFRIVQFSDVKASLPIEVNQKKIYYLPWGRQSKQFSPLPMGGWLLQSLLQQGKWDKFFPRLVKIPAVKFMEQDIEGKLQWFDVIQGSYIQGAILKQREEMRLYIVTLTPETLNNPFLRWPVLTY
jgi:hypothetical protein